jgi:hypothetical protein
MNLKLYHMGFYGIKVVFVVHCIGLIHSEAIGSD